MRRFRFVLGLLSLALLTLLVLSITRGPFAEAGGKDIKTKFNLVENKDFIVPMGASGTGEFELNGRDLDNLKFKVKYKAQGLEKNTWYYLGVTVREGFGGISVPVHAVVVGTVRTDHKGRLNFKGGGVLENVFDPSGVTTWRIDQQVTRAGIGTENDCVECVLVCSPTTKIELVGGELVPFVP